MLILAKIPRLKIANLAKIPTMKIGILAKIPRLKIANLAKIPRLKIGNLAKIPGYSWSTSPSAPKSHCVLALKPEIAVILVKPVILAKTIL